MTAIKSPLQIHFNWNQQADILATPRLIYLKLILLAFKFTQGYECEMISICKFSSPLLLREVTGQRQHLDSVFSRGLNAAPVFKDLCLSCHNTHMSPVWSNIMTNNRNCS